MLKKRCGNPKWTNIGVNSRQTSPCRISGKPPSRAMSPPTTSYSEKYSHKIGFVLSPNLETNAVAALRPIRIPVK